MTTSLCDRCFAPGQCCKALALFSMKDVELTVWDDDPKLPEQPGTQPPFTRTTRTGGPWKDDAGREYSTWFWSCSALLPSGRCGIYETRPDLCRRFEPASSPLCVHYQGAETGETHDVEW